MLVFVLFHLIFAIGAQNLSSITLEDGLGAASLNNIQHQAYLEPSAARHREEKSRLLNALKHESGEWGPSHPRYELLQALHDLYRYKDKYFTDLNQWKEVFEGLPDTQKEVVSAVTSHGKRFERFQENQKKNQNVVQDVLENALKYYGIAIEELEWFMSTEGAGENSVNPGRVSDILNHFIRDWSTGGPHRRDLGSEPILESLSALFPDPKDSSKEPKRVLVPGAGLSRLAHEIAQLGGFEVTANELSAHMNVVYRYVETLRIPEAERFYPYIDWWSYQPSMAELAQEIRFPDVAINASDVLLVEGDFTSIFQNSTGGYDAVVTLFFIDTAQNIMDYLETIQRVLKPGGVWINLGTFLYGASPFLHVSLEDLINITKKMNFKFLDIDERYGNLSLPGEKVRMREVCYLFNERAHRKKLYEAQFWIAEKI